MKVKGASGKYISASSALGESDELQVKVYRCLDFHKIQDCLKGSFTKMKK